MVNANLYATNQPVQERLVRGSGRVTRKKIYKFLVSLARSFLRSITPTGDTDDALFIEKSIG